MGETRQLTATVVDADGRAISGEPVTFESSDPSVLTVSESGLLTSVGPVGTSVITAAAGDITAEIEAEVVLAPSALFVSPASLALESHESVLLHVTVTDENSDSIPDAEIVFHTSNAAVASVDDQGYVTGGEAGTTTVYVTSGELRRDIPVTVTQVPTSMTITPTTAVVGPGGAQQFTATVLDRGGDPVPGAAVTWSSSDEDVLTVGPTGLAQSVGPEGTATITASSGSTSVTAEVFVGTPPTPSVLATVPLISAWGLSVSSGGRYLVTSIDGRLAGGILHDFTLPDTVEVNAAAFSAAVNQAGTRAYVARAMEAGGTVTGVGVVNLATNTLIDVLPVSGDPLSVALSTDESKVIVGMDGGIDVVDIASRTSVGGTPMGIIRTIIRHPTLPLLYVTVGADAAVELDAATGEVLRTFPMAVEIRGLAVAPDGSRLYALEELAGVIHVWNLATQTEEPSIATAHGGYGLAFPPDGKFLYVTQRDQLHILDPASGFLVREVDLGGWARQIAFAPDGTAVITNNDGTAEGGWVDFLR